MAVYEYECSNCGEFEVTQKMSDKPLKKCPKCGGKVKKLISSTSFVLKGGGWYASDYARQDTSHKRADSIMNKTIEETAREVTKNSGKKF